VSYATLQAAPVTEDIPDTTAQIQLTPVNENSETIKKDNIEDYIEENSDIIQPSETKITEPGTPPNIDEADIQNEVVEVINVQPESPPVKKRSSLPIIAPSKPPAIIIPRTSISEPKLSQPIWEGIIKTDGDKIGVKSYELNGNSVQNMLPQTLKIVGRMDLQSMTKYLIDIDFSSTRKRTVIYFDPITTEDSFAYVSYFEFLRSRNRGGVIEVRNTEFKEAFIFPLSSHHHPPSFCASSKVKLSGDKLLGIFITKLPGDNKSKSSKKDKKDKKKESIDKNKSSNTKPNLLETTNTLNILPSQIRTPRMKQEQKITTSNSNEVLSTIPGINSSANSLNNPILQLLPGLYPNNALFSQTNLNALTGLSSLPAGNQPAKYNSIPINNTTQHNYVSNNPPVNYNINQSANTSSSFNQNSNYNLNHSSNLQHNYNTNSTAQHSSYNAGQSNFIPNKQPYSAGLNLQTGQTSTTGLGQPSWGGTYKGQQYAGANPTQNNISNTSTTPSNTTKDLSQILNYKKR